MQILLEKSWEEVNRIHVRGLSHVDNVTYFLLLCLNIQYCMYWDFFYLVAFPVMGEIEVLNFS